MKEIVIAGGCFWGVAEYYRRLKGVYTTEVGFSQGHVSYPSYEQVCTQTTGHTEVVRIEYDENEISLEKIIEHFMRIVDPTSLNKQGNDIGPQYRCGIYGDDVEKIESIVRTYEPLFDKPFVVEIEPIKNYFVAEEYHQDYLIKKPLGYCHVDFSKIQPGESKFE